MTDHDPTARTVSFELLRHGPPHNQLLSRLTEYLGLCGNRAAVMLRLPFDHQEHLGRLEALSYRDRGAHEQRLAILEEMGQHMGQLLEVPGLVAELGAPPVPGQITHLRLIVTAHELALLPFECSVVPRGVGGAHNERLLLQPTTPVTLTREVRSAPTGQVRFPARPRILYAWASPPGVGAVPFREHLHALRRSLDPWIMPYPSCGTDDGPDHAEHRRHQVKSLLTLLPDAGIEAIEAACARDDFTHVHILAHGIPKAVQTQQRTVGLALQDDRGELDIVSGERLAAALRCRASDARPDRVPTVVTLASCDSGQVSSVVVHGGSVAHALHLSGIPVVVASQFPLSVEGSIVLTDELYRRMVLGEDLRGALHEVRKSLYSRDGGRHHDWASMVVYASLPHDYAEQVRANRYALAVQSGKGLRARAEALLRSHELGAARGEGQAPRPGHSAQQRQLCEELLSGVDVEADSLAVRAQDHAEAAGMRASLEKIRAELLFFAANLEGTPKDQAREHRRRSLLSLESARRLYHGALLESLSHHWQAVQYLALSHVLHRAGLVSDAPSSGLAHVARVAAEIDRARKRGEERAFADGSLAELCLLSALEAGDPDDSPAMQDAKAHLCALLEAGTPDGFAVHATRRQLVRYAHWWSVIASDPQAAERMQGLATSLIAVLDRGLGYRPGSHHGAERPRAGSSQPTGSATDEQRPQGKAQVDSFRH